MWDHEEGQGGWCLGPGLKHRTENGMRLRPRPYSIGPSIVGWRGAEVKASLVLPAVEELLALVQLGKLRQRASEQDSDSFGSRRVHTKAFCSQPLTSKALGQAPHILEGTPRPEGSGGMGEPQSASHLQDDWNTS